MTSSRMWFGLIACLCALLCGCGKKEVAPEVPAAAVTEEVEESFHSAHCYSVVDGKELTARVYFPENYDHAHQCPLVVVMPDTPFPKTPVLGQAIVALLDAPRPAGCPKSLLLTDYHSQVEFLVNNFAVDPANVFLAGGRPEHILFASLDTSFFAGACFFFDADLKCDFSEMPLRNLRNIPVYLDNAASIADCAGILELERLLGEAGNPRFTSPKRILGVGGEEAIVAAAFSWLAEKKVPQRGEILWEVEGAFAGEAWWLRPESVINSTKHGVISARSQITGKGWTSLQVTTRNISAFAIQTNATEFPQNHPILLDINGTRLATSTGKGWISFAVSAKGTWEQRNAHDKAFAKESSPAGIDALFRKKPVFVVSCDTEQTRGALWMKSAMAAAEAWQNVTGIAPVIKKDTEVGENDLEGHNLLLFGSPVDNRMTAGILEGNPSFLKQLFHALDEKDRSDDKLSAITLCPTGMLSSDTVVVAILANGDGAIQDAWKPLLENKTLHCDYIFHSASIHRRGRFTSGWAIP